MMFQVSEKRLQIIIGGGHIRDTVTREQTPPSMAHGFCDVCNDGGILWLFLRLSCEVFQEFRDGVFDLTSRSLPTVLITTFKLTV